MDDLSKKLKISKKTLYHCFGNKNELVRQTVQQHFAYIETRLDEISNMQISAVARMVKAASFAVEELSKVNPSMILDLHKYHPEVHQEMLVLRKNTIKELMMNNISNGRDFGFYRLDFNCELISELFAEQIIYITENWAQHNTNEAAQGVFEYAIYHLRGISTEKGISELSTIQQS
jgi:AcrR family transcriptional regulator